MNRMKNKLVLTTLVLITLPHFTYAGIFGDFKNYIVSQLPEAASLWDEIADLFLFACFAIGAGIFMFTRKGDNEMARKWAVGLIAGSLFLMISKQYLQ